MEWMERRREQSKWARKLQESLGDNYNVCFDLNESGMTVIYFKGELLKQVPNDEMKGSLNVYDFTVTGQWLWEHGFDMAGNKMMG